MFLWRVKQAVCLVGGEEGLGKASSNQSLCPGALLLSVLSTLSLETQYDLETALPALGISELGASPPPSTRTSRLPRIQGNGAVLGW